MPDLPLSNDFRSTLLSNIYAAPNAQLSDTYIDTVVETGFFALHGRIGRLRYVAYATAMYFLSVLAISVLMIPLAIAGISQQGAPSWVTTILMGVLIAGFAIIARRRLHDLGMSGWFILCNFIPFVNLYFGLIMLFKRGDEGGNEYGSQPSPNTTGVKILAFSLPVIAIIGIVAAMIIPTLR